MCLYCVLSTNHRPDFHLEVGFFYACLGFDTKNRLKYSFQSVFNAVPALHFRDDKVSIAKIRLVPITVSQLKCALHILIGDWYDSRSEKFFQLFLKNTNNFSLLTASLVEALFRRHEKSSTEP